jgi:hypothetical protein
VIAGATAVGGGDFTVVVLFEVESVVLLLVESVTIGCANVMDEAMIKSTAVAIFLIILFPKLLVIIDVWFNPLNYLGLLLFLEFFDFFFDGFYTS